VLGTIDRTHIGDTEMARTCQVKVPCSATFDKFVCSAEELATSVKECPGCGKKLTIRINYKTGMSHIPAHNDIFSAKECGAKVHVHGTDAPLTGVAFSRAFAKLAR
jgi:hypothetical protein